MCGDTARPAGRGARLRGCWTHGATPCAFRHDLARAAVEETLNPGRRLDLHRRLARCPGQPAAQAPPTSPAWHIMPSAADRTRTPCSLSRRSAAAAATAVGAYREAAAQYARALRFAGDRPAGERAALLEGRSRACYLADDQVEAIEVIEAGNRLPNEEACAVAGGPRAHAELTDYLVCRGLYTQARKAVATVTRLVSRWPETSERGIRVPTRRANIGYLDDDLEMRCIEQARTAEDVAEKLRRLRHRRRSTRDDRKRRAMARSPARTAAPRGGSQNSVVSAARSSRRRERSTTLARWARFCVDHALADTFLRRSARVTASRSTSISGGSTSSRTVARSHLDQDRWTEAAETATELLRDPARVTRGRGWRHSACSRWYVDDGAIRAPARH